MGVVLSICTLINIRKIKKEDFSNAEIWKKPNRWTKEAEFFQTFLKCEELPLYVYVVGKLLRRVRQLNLTSIANTY